MLQLMNLITVSSLAEVWLGFFFCFATSARLVFSIRPQSLYNSIKVCSAFDPFGVRLSVAPRGVFFE